MVSCVGAIVPEVAGVGANVDVVTAEVGILEGDRPGANVGATEQQMTSLTCEAV